MGPIHRFMRSIFLAIICCGALCTLPGSVQAQRYLTEYDSTLFIRDTVRPVVKRFENLHFSGYIQPQYQVAGSEGAATYDGGNFSEYSSNRFMLRRARVKLDYIFRDKAGHAPLGLFTFQIDATERGVNVRDMFARLYEPKGQNLSLTMGLFARPFGYEVNLSSAFRETPERGRMSQILMPTERDLGAMISFEQQGKKAKKLPLRLDVGLFNGQGLAAGGITDFDSYKDLIGRLTVKPIKVGPVNVSGGLSFLNGGWRQATRYQWEMEESADKYKFVVDSSLDNIGAKALRRYHGADVQVAYKHRWGKTEIRGEYWRGTQPGTAHSTANPGILPQGPTYLRPFDGAFFYLLQNLGNPKNELMLKYDWYDPNRKVKGAEIGGANAQYTSADIRYHAFGVGFTRHFTDNLKFLVYYNFVRNEATALSKFNSDLDDDVFTARFQLRF